MFYITPGLVRAYDFPDDVQMAITYEFSNDLLVVKRKVYGFLDFLGDLGGLSGSLRAGCTLAIIIFQYRQALSYVSNHTYLIEDGDELDNDNKSDGEIEDSNLKRMKNVDQRIKQRTDPYKVLK